MGTAAIVDALVGVAGFVAATGMLWLTPKIDPERRQVGLQAQQATTPAPVASPSRAGHGPAAALAGAG